VKTILQAHLWQLMAPEQCVNKGTKPAQYLCRTLKKRCRSH
jgi:hypothetical protein